MGPCEMCVCSSPLICLPDSDYRLGAATRRGKRHNKDLRMEEGWARQRLVAQEGSLSDVARIPSHKCPRWLVLGRWWTELEPAARGLTQVAWGEAYVWIREGEEP